MAMDYLSSITTLFGADAVISSTGASATLTFKPTQVAAAFGAPETAKPEAFILALLQKAAASQGITAARAMEVTKSNIIGTKDGVQVNGEQYIVRIYSGAGITELDPDTL